jgi:type IV pilus assembly protein PilY1
LVGGLNAGGSGYFALDITDPTKPKALWEFTDPNMGYSYGNPQITKLADGTWVVLLTSGYNNVPSPNGPQATGDGLGHLYVLNANSGALIRDINTSAGSAGTPSGLARISAAVKDPASDNTTQAVYGGDLLGNLWRFDINNNIGSSQTAYEAQLITTLKDASGVVQPISVKPEVGIVSNFVVIFVDTGQFLGVPDLSSSQVQTMYAIKDPMTVSASVTPSTPIYANSPRAATCASLTSTSCFVQQIASLTTCPTGSPASICTGLAPVMTGTSKTVSFSTQSGWFIDFPNTGERGNTDPVLALGTLGFTTNTPSTANSCSVGGFSYNWFLNYANGSAVSTSTTGVISTELGTHNADGSMSSTAFATSPTYFTLPDGTVKDLTCLSDGTCVESTPPIGSGGGSTRRTSWRELILQ